jgi:hypothetical protein
MSIGIHPFCAIGQESNPNALQIIARYIPGKSPSVLACRKMHLASETLPTSQVAPPLLDRRSVGTYSRRVEDVIHMGSLDTLCTLLLFLEQYGQDLDRRVQSELVGALPALHAVDSDAGLDSKVPTLATLIRYQ